MSVATHVVEAHGARIPLIGLGTWELRGRTCARVVEQALERGYRHVDTAELYDNEREVGEGLRTAGIKRDEVFITTKVWPSHFAPRELERSAQASLARLELSHVDLLLLHWPNLQIPLRDTLGALCKVKRMGLTRHIGVSNLTVALIEEAVKLADEPLVCNQIEVHPFIDQDKVMAVCRGYGLAVTAYCPLARGKVPGNEVLARIGKTRGKSAAQVALRYLVQQGIVAIPRTPNPDHLAANLAVFDFNLSDAEMAEIDKLKQARMRVVNPPHAPRWDN